MVIPHWILRIFIVTRIRLLSRSVFLPPYITDRRRRSLKTIYLYTELLDNYCLYLYCHAMVLAKCYYVTFKITTEQETTRSLERHSATNVTMSVSPCKALHLQYTLRPACYKTNKSISLRPESIDLHKELLYDHFLFYCHAMFPQTT